MTGTIQNELMNKKEEKFNFFDINNEKWKSSVLKPTNIHSKIDSVHGAHGESNCMKNFMQNNIYFNKRKRIKDGLD